MEATYDISTTAAPALDTGVFAGLMAMLAGLWIVILIVAIFFIVCNWKIYTKAGKPGWAAIVPFYNIYVLVEIVGRPMWFFWAYLGGMLLALIPVIGQILALGAMVLMIVLMVDLAKAFGKDTGFAILLILVPIIGLPMLAFGNATYVGAGTKPAAAPEKPAAPAA